MHDLEPHGTLASLLNEEREILKVDSNIEDITVYNSIIPHRVEGRFRCLPHKDEGLVNGKWAKGETTAANERRYVLKMQQDEINYKTDGLNSLKYNLKSVDQLTPFAKMINVTL